MQAVSVSTGTDGAFRVALHGEIDYTNAAPVVEVIRTAVQRDRPASLRVDLTEVTFLDSSGIGVLVQAMKLAEEVSADFRVEQPNPQVLDQLRLTGLLAVFGIDESPVAR